MEQAAGANAQWLIQFVFASFVFGGSEKKMTVSRRHFLDIGTFGVAAAMLTPTLPPETTQHTLRIALLHLAPLPGDLTYNRQLVETAVTTAAGLGASWIVTPELCIC